MTADEATAAIRTAELRSTLGLFVTGVTIVTIVDEDGHPRGMTANSFTSVSLDPPLVLICIARRAHSYEAFKRAGGFAVNVLGDEQRHLAELFATKAPDKFDHVDHRLGQGGAPILHGSLAWIDCRTHDQVEAGDHVVLIGAVKDFGANPGQPLAYCKGGFLSFGMQQEAVFRPRGKNVVVGCVADHDGRVLLREIELEGRRQWTLPDVALARGETGGLAALNRMIDAFGTTIDVSFIYSVFEDADHESVYLIYRGKLTAPPTAGGGRLFAESEVPWDDLASRQVRNVVDRFFKEHVFDQFGIYVDLDEGGQVAMVSEPPREWKSYVSDLEE